LLGVVAFSSGAPHIAIIVGALIFDIVMLAKPPQRAD
jgi:hypothetical protein